MALKPIMVEAGINSRNMKKWLLKKKIGLIFTLFGILAGYLYWKFIGCASGTCAITSVWYRTMIDRKSVV